MSGKIEVNEGDILSHFSGATEVLHRVEATYPADGSVSLKQVNTDGPKFLVPASLIAAGLKAKCCGLYTRHAVSA